MTDQKKAERRWKRIGRRFNRAFKKAERLSEKQKDLIAVMQTAYDELHRINEELERYDQEDEP